MKKKVLRVGLTGNIGSGKSTVARLFEQLGIPAYYADQRAKQLMVTNEVLRNEITAAFGAEAYVQQPGTNGEMSKGSYTLNRAFLAEQVFGNDQQLQLLNGLVHPAVAQDALQWHNSQENVAYTLYEAAITFETGGYKVLDKVIVVSAPEEIRLRRVMKRDGVQAAQVKARMDKQWPEARKIEMADFVIDNSGDQLLMSQVLAVHRQLLELKTDG
ncbi:MAG: dephospho-CoA kinase [Bacteroidota bacterium]